MKLTIRNGMFETNSSSMHSIVICKDGGKYSDEELKHPIYEGELYLYNNEARFGRSPFELLTTWDRKVAFALASLCDATNAKAFIPELEDIIAKNNPYCHALNLEYIHDNYYGYVDHQSVGLLSQFLKEEHITLEDFIFNSKYIVVIDGDEYCVFNAVKGTFKLEDKIEKEVFTHDVY